MRRHPHLQMRRRRHRPPPSPISRSATALIPFSPSPVALPDGSGEVAAPPDPRPSEGDRASRSQMRSATLLPHNPGRAPLLHPPPPSILRKSHRDVEALLADRTRLEAAVKIQQEFWLHRDGVLRDHLDETRRVEDCLRRGDAAKLDLLLRERTWRCAVTGSTSELDRQVPLMDEMDDKVDRANADLKNTNVRLKQTILQMRSSRNFCIGIVLLCVILGIAAYLYKFNWGGTGVADL